MEPNSQRTLAIVELFYQYLAERRFDALASLFSPDVDWFIAGEESMAPWLGKKNNRGEIKAFFELLLDNIESVRFQIDHVFVDYEKAVVTGEFASRMLQTDKMYESLFSAHFTIKDDLIVKYRFLEDSLALVKALR